MPNNTTKGLSDRDAPQTLQASFNDIDSSLQTAGFLTGKIGRRVTQTISTTTVAGDTSSFAFSENFGATPLYTIQVVYTDGTQTTFLTATYTM